MNVITTSKDRIVTELPYAIISISGANGKLLDERGRRLFTYVIYKQITMTTNGDNVVWSGNFVFRPIENDNTVTPILYVNRSTTVMHMGSLVYTVASHMTYSSEAAVITINTEVDIDMEHSVRTILAVNPKLDGISYPYAKELLINVINWLVNESGRED